MSCRATAVQWHTQNNNHTSQSHVVTRHTIWYAGLSQNRKSTTTPRIPKSQHESCTAARSYACTQNLTLSQSHWATLVTHIASESHMPTHPCRITHTTSHSCTHKTTPQQTMMVRLRLSPFGGRSWRRATWLGPRWTVKNLKPLSWTSFLNYVFSSPPTPPLPLWAPPSQPSRLWVVSVGGWVYLPLD